MEVDVLVVGAGPAGSTTARFCAGDGTDVLVIDRRREVGFPVQCGELLPHVEEMYTIFPEGEHLEELFTVPDHLVHGESEHVDLVSPGGRTYRCDFRSHILDRRAFDKHLAKLAVAAGARLETGVSFLGMKEGVAETTLGPVSAKVVVGADGPNSRTARSAGLANPALRYPAVTCQARGSFDPQVKMFFGRVAPGGYAWVIPKGESANVGLGFDPKVFKGRPREAFDRFVSGLDCTCEGVTMGIVPMSGPVPSTVKGKVLLVGDAAGHVMATNGGGIPTAMIAGRAAGRTIREHLSGSCRLEEYETHWRKVMETPLRTSVRTRRMADMVFGSDRLLGAAMFMLGRRGLDRAIRCRRLLL
ncbi:MAG: NAD(P)/FAD-dependent oxidoreductase [Candidatus Thermoplasmatota archaeon]